MRGPVQMVVVAAAALTLAAPATAAPFGIPSTTDNLEAPAVAVDPAGTAFVAWYDTSSGTSGPVTVDICAIPSGATACAHVASVTPTTGYTESVQPELAIGPTGLPILVVMTANGAGAAETQYTSTDGGATWSAGAANPIGDLAIRSAALDPHVGNGILVGAAKGTPGQSGNVLANAAEPGVGAPYHDVALVPAGEPGPPTEVTSAIADSATGIAVVHAFTEGPTAAQSGAGYSFYSGPGLKGQSDATVLSDLGTAANWTTATLGDGGGDLSLAGGPAGIWLSEGVGASAAHDNDAVIRRFTGSGFTAPVSEDCGDAATAHYGAAEQANALFEDPVSGALHLLYLVSGPSAGEDVRYTELANGTQSPPVTLAHIPDGAPMLISPGVASGGPDHPGLAIWATKSGDTSWSLVASWLPAVAFTGCASGAQQQGPATTSVSVGGRTVTLSAPPPAACVARNARLVPGLTTTGRRRSARVTQVRLFLDRGVAHRHRAGRRTVQTFTPNATVRHLPAHPRLRLAGTRAGRHTLRAIVTFLERRGRRTHAVTRTLRLTVSVCR